MEKPIEILKASECRCCVCGEAANVFWPILESDVPDILNQYFEKDLNELIVNPKPHCIGCMVSMKIRFSQTMHDRLDKSETERRILLGTDFD